MGFYDIITLPNAHWITEEKTLHKWNEKICYCKIWKLNILQCSFFACNHQQCPISAFLLHILLFAALTYWSFPNHYLTVMDKKKVWLLSSDEWKYVHAVDLTQSMRKLRPYFSCIVVAFSITQSITLQWVTPNRVFSLDWKCFCMIAIHLYWLAFLVGL